MDISAIKADWYNPAISAYGVARRHGTTYYHIRKIVTSQGWPTKPRAERETRAAEIETESTYTVIATPGHGCRYCAALDACYIIEAARLRLPCEVKRFDFEEYLLDRGGYSQPAHSMSAVMYEWGT